MQIRVPHLLIACLLLLVACKITGTFTITVKENSSQNYVQNIQSLEARVSALMSGHFSCYSE